jgi:hypothetical protein
MTDRAFEPADANPFDQIDPNEQAINYKASSAVKEAAAAPAAVPPKAANDNPFDAVDYKLQPGSSVGGAFARGAERSILPAAGSFPAIGAGAEAGFVTGAALGGPFAEITAPVGGLLGGVAAGFGASALIAKAQDWALAKLPDSWREKIGMDDRQAQLDEGQHPVASFLGGLAPYAITMRPGAIGSTPLPENATALQRIMAHPATARVFGGAAMGGMELGQEEGQGQTPDWTKVAISTGFGMVFNKPTRIGESLTEIGARPARVALGIPEPTVAQAGDAKVAGPGITEDVFQGAHQQEPSAEMTAQEAARTEQSVIGAPQKGPDVNDVARRMAPETFQNYDDLLARRDEFRKWIDEFNEPPQEAFDELQAQRGDLQRQLDEHVAARGGYASGPEARRLRAQIRDVQSQHDLLTQRAQAFREGTATDTADVAQARKHLLDTEFKLRDLQPEVQAAYRRAADAIGAGTVEPEAAEVAPAQAETGRQGATLLPAERGTEPPAAVARPTEEANVVEPERPVAAGAEIPGEHPAVEPIGAPAASPAAAAHEPVAGAPAPPTGEQAIAAPSGNRTIEQQRDFIRADVSRQLISAGRPAEEAEAAGALEAAYYETRAARFKGARGTAQDLYEREGPEILGEGQRSAQQIVRQPRGQRKVDETKLSLLQFLARRGGIDAGERNISDVRSLLGTSNKFVPGFGALIRKGGMSLDRAREAAVEAGYLHDAGSITGGETESSINHLLEAMDSELRGNKVYRAGYEPLPPAEHPHGPEPEEGEAAGAEAPHPQEPPSPLMTEADYADFELQQLPANRGTFDPNDPNMLRQRAQGGIVLNPQGLPGRNWLGSEDVNPILRMMKDADASTFIHESGHKYLADMLRDATHEAAPDALKADAATTLNWLGVDKAENLTRRAHEKFARGFEQYLREGTAPSPGLASVFAKFRTWLLNVYQTLKGLGKPINEDIQGVFDRLLSETPQRTVMAGETTPKPSLADLHETDAAMTEPHEAEPTGDMVIAERNRYITEPPAGVSRERAAEIVQTSEAQAPGERPGGQPGTAGTEPPGQGGASAGGREQVGGDSGAPGPRAAGGGMGAIDRAIEPSGGEALREGDGLPGTGAKSRTGANDQSHPLAANPATVFGPDESPFVDKAGNIRVENLTSREDVAQAIHDAADANNNFIGDRRGVITDGQVMDLAADLGMDFQKLNTRKIGQAFNAEQIVAARQLLVQSATNVSTLMKRAATGTDEDVMAYAMAKDRHQMIQAQVAGITAEAGRALRAFRNISGQEEAMGVDQFIRSATGKTLFQLREEAKLGSTLDTPQQVSKFMNDAQKRTFGRMVLEYWINGLISGPATHTTYMVGNTILALEKAGPETALAAGIGRLRAAMGRQGETVRLGEVAAQLRGGATSIAPAVKAAAEAFRTGVTTQLPGEAPRQAALPFQPGTELVPAAVLDESARFSDLMNGTFAVVRGLRDGIMAGGALVKAGGVEGAPLLGARYSNLGATPDITVRGVNVLPLGTAVRLPGRFIAAIHSFFRSVNYSMAKAGDAYHVAANEGLTGQAFDARVAEIRANPSEKQMEGYVHGATELTLMGKGSPFVQALSRLTNTEVFGFPILKFVDPFVHIAGNIIDQSIVQRTPIGILSAEIRADLMGHNGNVAQDTAMARMLAGTALSVTFGSLAAEGLATGSGPEDHHKAAMWRLAGYQAHSVRVGDTWYQVNRLGPMGMLMGVAADMYDVAHNVGQGDMLAAGAFLQHAVTQNILDESFMRGPAELIQALEDPGRYGEAYIRNMLSSFVPYSVGIAQMARASDPYSRQARTVMDQIKNKIPGLSETLLPRRDVWGEEMPNPAALGAAGLTAIYERQISNDPVNLAMLNLGISPAAVTRKIRNVDLSDQQYDDYARIAGRMTKMRLDAIVQSPDYQTWPNHIRHDVLTEVIRQSRESARGIVMMKNPDILSAAVKTKLDRLND